MGGVAPRLVGVQFSGGGVGEGGVVRLWDESVGRGMGLKSGVGGGKSGWAGVCRVRRSVGICRSGGSDGGEH